MATSKPKNIDWDDPKLAKARASGSASDLPDNIVKVAPQNRVAHEDVGAGGEGGDADGVDNVREDATIKRTTGSTNRTQ